LRAKTLVLVAVIAATTTVAGCSRVKSLIGGKPKGQVVATVNGEEITSLDLRSELGGFASRDPKVMKQAEQVAVQRLVLRTLVDQKAKEQKLDKAVDYVLQMRRGEQNLLAQLYQRKIASSVPAPTKQEAETYVANHPEKFANRKILVLEQVIASPTKLDPQTFKPINTLDEIKALFDSDSIPYQENVAVLDTLTTDPRMIEQLNKLPPNEVFVVPQQGVLVFNHINQTRSAPFRGDMAVSYSVNLLRQQRVQEAVAKAMQSLQKESEPKIVYNAAYKPALIPMRSSAAPGTPPAPAAPPKAP
jgi:peptidyl-prolyl cis-trans isomerase C